MKLRLLSVLLAAAGLGGCASYDYAGGGAGGYYHGRPSVDHYSGYGAYGGYGGYGGFPTYRYGRYGYDSRYYGGYGYYPYYHPYYPYPRYYIVRPPHGGRGDGHDHDHDHDHDRDPPGEDGPRGERPPPWRRPDGRYVDSGGVLIPGQRAMPRPMVPAQVNPGASAPSRPSVQQPTPRPQRAERAERREMPAPRQQQRPAGRGIIRDQEN